MAVFSNASRYRSVPDVNVLDARGRTLPAKDFRPLPAVTGTYRHVVHQGDRIDQLASTYYSRPLIWWNICDANPDFLSPLALVAAEPIVTTVLPLGPIDGVPQWSALVTALTALPGVETVTVQDDVVLDPVRQDVGDGTQVTIYRTRPVRSVLVGHNRVSAPPELLAGTARGLGWPVGTLGRLDQVGNPIVVPPAVRG